MRSFLLAQIGRLVVPLALLLGAALLLAGHNEPGGGFVAGLSVAIAALLGLAAYGPAALRHHLRLAPERLALAGVVLLLASLLVPLVAGAPALTHAHGELVLPLAKWKWHTALLFDLGVVLAVGGGGAAAGLALWELPRRRGGER